jgi:putative ABC transport system permease protein
MLIALRNLFKDKMRFAISVSSVALAVLLILLLSGFLSGMNAQITAYLNHAPGSLVVAQAGVKNLLGATSLLPAGTDGDVKARGAAQVVPVLTQFIILDLHDKKQPVYLVGYNTEMGGGPWRLAAGREPRRDNEVVFDEVLAQRHNLAIGSTVEILDKDFTVVGLSEGTSSWMTSFIFIRITAAETLLRVPGGTSFLLVTPSNRLTPDELRERLSNLSGVEVLLKREVMANDLTLFTRFFSAPLQLMTGIAFLIGALVVGLVIYTATVERQREYGVLKAIGARNGVLYRVVTTQAFIAAGLGSALGVGLTFAAAELIMDLRPQFLIVIEPAMIAQALLAAFGMALLAALFPARLVAGLAPADVFRK